MEENADKKTKLYWSQLRLPEVNFKKEIDFLDNLIQFLLKSLHSEKPEDYGVNSSSNLDVFAWEKVESARTANSKILLVVERMQDKIEFIHKEYVLKGAVGVIPIVNDLERKPEEQVSIESRPLKNLE